MFGMRLGGSQRRAIAQKDLRRRYWTGAVSLVGAASMVPVSLLQLGLVNDLPDPPLRGFDSKKVNLSDEARLLGVRDGPITLMNFLANIPLAIAGGKHRARRTPWIPMVAGAKALGEALGGVWFFSKMPRIEKAWCGYCIVAAAASVGVFALTLPEALRAVARRRS